MFRTIKTDELSANKLPDANADWDEISIFALTFDPQLELGTTDIYTSANTIFNEESTVQELRLSLFIWQRWWNSRLHEIDAEGLGNLRRIIELMRSKIDNIDLR